MTLPDLKKVIDLPPDDNETPGESLKQGCLFDIFPLLAILGSGGYIYYLLQSNAELSNFIVPAVVIMISLYALYANGDGYGHL